jgi:ssDNA-binding replication factor A large subunit
MTNEELIKQILSKHPKISREEILGSLEAEKKKTGGLIAEETLWRLIAAKYGIEIIKRRTIRRMSIKNLVAGLNDVTLTGRVIAVFPPRKFEGEKSGKVTNLIVADEDDTLGVVLWNDKVDLIESGELKAGQVVRFSHGYTRKDCREKIELHMGIKSQVEVKPENVKAEEYPTLCKFTTKISKITNVSNCVHLVGKVKKVYPISTFTRRDSSSGKFLRLKLADKTGEIPVVIWNEKAEKLEKEIKVDSSLELANAKIKENLSGELEVQANSYTYIKISDRLDF